MNTIKEDIRRFGAGLPRVNDGSLLFLQHMISKFEDVLQNGKIRVTTWHVFSGSPLSPAVRDQVKRYSKWIIEEDWLEAIIALPEQMFYNTVLALYLDRHQS